MFHRLISLTFLLILSLSAWTQRSPANNNLQRFDRSMSPREMDSAYAMAFNRQERRFSNQVMRTRTTSGRPAAPTQRVNSISDIIQRTNSLCYDTSSRFFLDSDSLMYYLYDPVRTRDGNLLFG